MRPVDRQELVQITQASRRALEDQLVGLGDAQLTEPALDDGWSVKDVLAHVSAWERMFIGWIEALMRGEKPDRPEFFSQEWTDTVNARVYKENRERSLADVRAESQQSYEAILAFINRMSDEDLFDPQRFTWTNGREIAPWLRANADEHYDEHREQIAAWRARG
jgi:hypothetical protein